LLVQHANVIILSKCPRTFAEEEAKG
jgi:hypothetical protein